MALKVERQRNEQDFSRENIKDHIHKEQSFHPEATGALTSILEDLAGVAKEISHVVSMAGLEDKPIHDLTGEKNIQGEDVKVLDRRANEHFKNILGLNPNVAGYASEEDAEFIPFPEHENGKYIVWSDPLDGSANLETNNLTGSIFGIYARVSDEKTPIVREDFLQPGRKQVCAGYFLYGPSTLFVYTTGQGVFSFTLNREAKGGGKFELPRSYSPIKTPEIGKIYSVNEGNSYKAFPDVNEYINFLKGKGEYHCGTRYDGSFVSDLHRILLLGGVFIYPKDTKEYPEGKLRVNCELNPLAFIAQQTGGLAIDGCNQILDIVPRELHQRSQVIIGSRKTVELFMEFSERFKS